MVLNSEKAPISGGVGATRRRHNWRKNESLAGAGHAAGRAGDLDHEFRLRNGQLKEDSRIVVLVALEEDLEEQMMQWAHQSRIDIGEAQVMGDDRGD
jgi:hypothetical protein